MMPRYVLSLLLLLAFAQPAGGPTAHSAVTTSGFGGHEASAHEETPSRPRTGSLSPQTLEPELEPEQRQTRPPPAVGDRDALMAEAPRLSREEICRTIEEAAADNALPVAFFSRLIWQESRFDPRAISRAGAMGIAQFMPGTAIWRGLSNPFHPVEALRVSAAWLAELRDQYGGNLGLAAAAYNAGPGRVQKWLTGRSRLPGETRAYVRIITGRSADEWAATTPSADADVEGPASVPCGNLRSLVAASAKRPHRPSPTPGPAWAPWGVQLAGDWSEHTARARYERLQKKYESVLGRREPIVFRVRAGARAAHHLVRVAETTREAAEKLCARLRSAGGNCLVSKNPGAATMVNPS